MDERLRYWLEGQVLSIDGTGDFSEEPVFRLLNEAFSDSAMPNQVAILVDSRASTAKRSPGEVQRIVRRLRKWSGRVKGMAVVVSSDISYGLTRQASVYAELDNWEVRPFRDIDSAKAWLAKKLRQ